MAQVPAGIWQRMAVVAAVPRGVLALRAVTGAAGQWVPLDRLAPLSPTGVP